MKLRVYCPAKVNLFLAVGPRDARGYHPLRTIFQAVDLFDVLDVTLSRNPAGATAKIDVVGAEIPEDNTITKALRLSREVFSAEVERLRLEKHIPLQSGLGGGSSDAAGLLRALNHIMPVTLPELESVAAAIGTDAPFFLTGGRARGEHYGDRITPLPNAPEEWYVIAKPPIGCPTAEMYAKLDEKPRDWRDWPDADILYNDFERVAPPECLDLIERLRALGARDAALSGSGSGVFGRFRSRTGAKDAAETMRSQGIGDVWTAQTLTRAESLSIVLLPGK